MLVWQNLSCIWARSRLSCSSFARISSSLRVERQR
jgi:hypothetical protein